ncbi:protein of unknown function [Enterobacter cancerogenus]|nr:protein of unknown function [Enterobacter cancerogenus]
MKRYIVHLHCHASVAVLRHEENPIPQAFANDYSDTKRKVFFVTVRYNSPSQSRHPIQGRVVCSKC